MCLPLPQIGSSVHFSDHLINFHFIQTRSSWMPQASIYSPSPPEVRLHHSALFPPKPSSKLCPSLVCPKSQPGCSFCVPSLLPTKTHLVGCSDKVCTEEAPGTKGRVQAEKGKSYFQSCQMWKGLQQVLYKALRFPETFKISSLSHRRCGSQKEPQIFLNQFMYKSYANHLSQLGKLPQCNFQ